MAEEDGLVRRTVEIDGRDFRTLDEFFEVIGAALIPGERWGKNLDAFNDILCWPLARDPEPYILMWRRAKLSQRRLNHGAAAMHWHDVIRVGGGKPSAGQADQLARAERCEGPTAFDWIVQIIEQHPNWLSLRLD
jgi:RNAse (barnase) inhibitor barstar